jgi:hypothetical protein
MSFAEAARLAHEYLAEAQEMLADFGGTSTLLRQLALQLHQQIPFD